MTKTGSLTVGCPTHLNAQKIARIAKAVQKGRTRAEAAAELGMPLGTLQRWITQGRRVRDADGAAATGLDLLTLRLVLELESAERKRRAVDRIMSDEDLGRDVAADKKPLGRPALLTDDVVNVVAPLVGKGRLDEAAKAAGVDRRSISRWLARGREVHADGRARTEYERRCGMLYARVEAAQQPEAVPALSPGQGGSTNPGGGKRVVTAEDVRELVAAIRGGATREQAAARIGVSYRTLARWLTVGARVEAGTYESDHERLCRELRLGVDRADRDRRRPVVVGELKIARGGLAAAPSIVEDRPMEPVIVIGRPRRFLGRLIANCLRMQKTHRS
ncbi:hypothetical protein ACFUJY_29585 [Streptomyces sp. NPDC057249]|uniref:hypothetical protein n=1 Tax=Streptomyces sp. NPDC057249 TaxID=3346067 RepID=UPI00363A6B99